MKEIMPIQHNFFFWKMEWKKEMPKTYFLEANKTLIPKRGKEIPRKENQTNIFLEHEPELVSHGLKFNETAANWI